MWSFFRHEEQDDNDGNPSQETNLQFKKGHPKRAQGGKHRMGFGRSKSHHQPKRKLDDGGDHPEILNISVSDEAMNVAETHSGIEVSLDWKAAAIPVETDEPKSEEDAMPATPVVSFAYRLRQCRRVHRSQFSVAYPALDRLSDAVDASPTNTPRRSHRVPILKKPPEFDIAIEKHVSLLENYATQDEETALKSELKKLQKELQEIEQDRKDLDQTCMRLPETPERHSQQQDSGPPNWDAHFLLAIRKDLSSAEKSRLQRDRGLYLTLNMQNPRAREAFLAKCGSKVGVSHGKQVKESFGASVSLGPYNCRHGGAGSTVRHISIMRGGDTSSSFFLSRDSGKSFTWGPLPPRLYRRMTREGLTPQNGDGGLLYLSTGPRGCYYCQFRSGECWWGTIENDLEFESIVDSWDVYRVSFGPIVTFADGNGDEQTTNSWIILARDGRVAWKNVPVRLHNLLYGRLADWAAPLEVSLGPGDSYFVRFLDGTADYLLPAAISNVCEHIEKNGGIITDIVLHPDVSEDYIIRHTELTG